MRRFTSARLAAGSALLCVCLVDAARPRYGGTLRVETSAAMRTLNPAVEPVDEPDANARRWLQPLIFETLVTPDAGGLKPALAVQWESDPESKRWRFRLRPRVTLHDGTTLDAGRVAAALATQSREWTVTGTADVVTIESGQTLPDLPWQLAETRHAIAFGRPEGGEPIGTGPFAIERWEPKRLMLRAHDDHWAGRPFLDKVTVEMARPPAGQMASLDAGFADLVALRPQDARRYEQRGLKVAASRPIELVALVFQGRTAAPAARSAREALALTVDRQALADVVLQRRASPAQSLLPSWLDVDAAPIDADRDLAQAGSIAATLPATQRTVTLAVASDAVLMSVADRLIVDAREAGLNLTMARPGSRATADARLVRVRLDATTPDRARAAAMRALELQAPGGSERSLLEPLVIVPIVHLPEIYAFGPRVEAWNEPMVRPTGAWNLANLWLKADR